MSLSLIEVARSLDALGSRVRGVLTDRVLDLVFRAGVRGGLRGSAGLPLGPDPSKPSYWTARPALRRPKDRYLKPY